MAVLDWFSYCPFIASPEKDVAAGINLHNEDTEWWQDHWNLLVKFT